MSVNAYISDLFFNTQHENDGEYNNLDGEASDLIQALGSLGVETPSVNDLVADFYDRL